MRSKSSSFQMPPAFMAALAAMLVLVPALSAGVRAQPFYFGADLSYANQMEDCGAAFKESGVPKDVYRIFADHGTNLVRVRLWVDPAWQHALQQPPGVKAQYSDLADVKEAIARARAAGMQVMLGFHYSDVWADPGRQVIPARWRSVADDLEALTDSVYRYTRRTLLDLDDEGLMPDVVQVGNENNSGLLVHRAMDANFDPEGVVSRSWARHAELFNAAIRAVREVGSAASVNPRIALHYAGLSGLDWFYQNLRHHGVTDFDVMGFSYYYAWQEASIAEMGDAIRALKAGFPGYAVMPVETGYPWSMSNFDVLPNIITRPDPAYLPVSPEKQLEYMVDYAREVMQAGGVGVIFWEPAWVSTPCRTPWGQGSSHDHVAFFSPSDYDFMDNGGGRWAERRFYEETTAIPPAEPAVAPRLHAAYPNPFRQTTTLSYDLPGPAHVTVAVYDALGRRVAPLADRVHPPGRHQVSIDAAGLAPGLYLIRLITPTWTRVQHAVRIE